MPTDDDGPGRPSRGYLHDDGGGSVAASNETQAARWATLESLLPEDAVRDRIRRALAPRQPFAYGAVISGSEGEPGFLIRFRSGSRVLVGEVDLAGWEGGTQVHLAMPAEQKRKHLQVLADWLGRVLAERKD